MVDTGTRQVPRHPAAEKHGGRINKAGGGVLRKIARGSGRASKRKGK